MIKIIDAGNRLLFEVTDEATEPMPVGVYLEEEKKRKEKEAADRPQLELPLDEPKNDTEKLNA